MADRLNWSIGKHGKGLVTKEGDIHTWPVDFSLNPHHVEYARMHNLESYNRPVFNFHIDPSGGIDDGGINYMNNSGSPDQFILDNIMATDPRHYIAQNDDEDWSLDSMGPPEQENLHRPDYNFVLGTAWEDMLKPGIACPRCHSEETMMQDADTIRCNHCRNYFKPPNLLTMIPGQSPKPYDEFFHGKVAADDELHIALSVPDKIADRIHEWAEDQDWPKGTELEPKDEYHITMLYVPEGYEEQKDADWFRHTDGYDVEVVGLDEFGEGDELATVLRLQSPEVQQHADDLQDMAENRELEISRFPGGYKPHLTIAYGPGKPAYARVPKLKFKSGPSSISTPRTSSETDGAPLDQLVQWLADMDYEEPMPPSPHHESPMDMVPAPSVSPSAAPAYWPPGHEPDMEKKSAEELRIALDKVIEREITPAEYEAVVEQHEGRFRRALRRMHLL